MGKFLDFFFFKNKFISSSQNMDRLSSPHFIKKNDYNKKEKRMKSLVYPVIKTMDRVLPNGAISTEAMGLQTRLHCFPQILHLDSRMMVEGRDGCCFLMWSCFHCGQVKRSQDEWDQAGEDEREEVLFELSLDGG